MQAQIDDLTVAVRNGFQEVKEMFQSADDRVREVEKREASCQPLVDQKIDAAWRKIEEHTADLKTMRDTIQALQLTIAELVRTQTQLKWLGNIIGSAVVVALIGAVLALVIK